MGKHRPSHEVVFDKLLQDSMDTHGNVLSSKLKECPAFSNIKSFKAEFNTSSSDLNNNTIDRVSVKEVSVEEAKGGGSVNRTTIFLITLAIIGVWTFIAAVVHAVKRSNKRNFYEKNYTIIMDSPMHVSIGVDDEDRRNSSNHEHPSHVVQNAEFLLFLGGLLQCRAC